MGQKDGAEAFAPDFVASEVMHFYLRDVTTGLYHNLFPSLTAFEA